MIKVQPRSRRPGLRGTQDSIAGPRLKVAVAEAAEDGKANSAVCAVLAKVLHRPAASVRILTGTSSREKTVSVAGDAVVLMERLRLL
jgi:hypothetical protein